MTPAADVPRIDSGNGAVILINIFEMSAGKLDVFLALNALK